MNTKIIRIPSILILLSFLSLNINAQCPGCITDVNFTISPAAPGITPDTLPDGMAGVYYDSDISFYLPAEFNTQGFDVTLTKLEVLSVSGLPFGMSFQSSSANNIFFPSSNPPTTEHGCAKVCGTAVFPGQYNMVVFVRAYVNTIIGNQTSDDSFSIPIKILPGSSGNASFTVTNGTGCGSVTASFSTNLPSNGMSGYSYNWNFGNGISSYSETPPDMTFNNPGQYPIICETVIDTLSFNYLNNVTVLSTSCTDFGSKPDLYIKLKNASGTTLLQAAVQENLDPPVSFTIPGIQLYHNQNYTLEVWDEDAFLGGSDDNCKNFTIPGSSSSNTITSGSDAIMYTVSRPMLTFKDTVTVTVYPQPQTPQVTATPTVGACLSDSILLTSTLADNYQWHKDTSIIMGANQQNLYVYTQGSYFVVTMDNNGCQAQSDTSDVSFFSNPPKPTFWRQGDSLRTILAGFGLQWYFNGNPINGATGQTCFIAATGEYHVLAISTHNCITSSDTVYYQSSSSGIADFKSISHLNLFPNPNKGAFTLQLTCASCEELTVRVIHITGQVLHNELLFPTGGNFEKLFDLSLAQGMYIIEVVSDGTVLKREKMIVQ